MNPDELRVINKGWRSLHIHWQECSECGVVDEVRDLGWAQRHHERGTFICDPCEREPGRSIG